MVTLRVTNADSVQPKDERKAFQHRSTVILKFVRLCVASSICHMLCKPSAQDCAQPMLFKPCGAGF